MRKGARFGIISFTVSKYLCTNNIRTVVNKGVISVSIDKGTQNSELTIFLSVHRSIFFDKNSYFITTVYSAIIHTYNK